MRESREIGVEHTAPPIGVTEGRPAVLGAKHMVSSCHYLASLAGLRMFPRGGSAIDAGVAAGIALNVLERHLTDFGGVAPIIVFRPGLTAPESIDGFRRWPGSLDLDAHPATYGGPQPPGTPRPGPPAACGGGL